MQHLAPESGLQTIGHMAWHLFIKTDRHFADVGIEFFSQGQDIIGCFFIAQQFNQGDQGGAG